MKNLFLLFCSFCLFIGFSQNEYPQNIFRNPMDLPMILSGNFGELRHGHFHSGLDIKTPSEGQKIYSIFNGFVSRIKIATNGYGKAIYITHPNGFTSVYAHLQKFSPKIEEYVKKNQYKKESFEIELYSQKTDLPIELGEIIAFSGNTGGSSGPHLHFEIRDTKTQKTINPELFGYKIQDKIPPQINNLFVYPLSETTLIRGENKRQKINFHKQGKNQFLSDRIQVSGKVGIGIQVLDKKDLAKNSYGIYKISVFENNSEIFSYKFDELSFAENHYINRFTDYSAYVELFSKVQLLYKKQNNKLSIYKEMQTDGGLEIQEGEKRSVWIVVQDFNGNKTELEVLLEGKKIDSNKTLISEKKGLPFVFTRENIYETAHFLVNFPANSFYENDYILVSEEEKKLKIEPLTLALSKSFEIKAKNNSFSEKEVEKVFLSRIHPKSKKNIYHKTQYKENFFIAKTQSMGEFILVKDSISPSISPMNFTDKINTKNLAQIQIKIQDDLSGIGSYRAEIDGKWVLAEYEPKKNMLFIEASEVFKYSENPEKLRIKVTDKVNNLTEVLYQFNGN